MHDSALMQAPSEASLRGRCSGPSQMRSFFLVAVASGNPLEEECCLQLCLNAFGASQSCCARTRRRLRPGPHVMERSMHSVSQSPGERYAYKKPTCTGTALKPAGLWLPVNVHELIKSAVHQLRWQSAAKKTRLSLKLAAHDCMLIGDRDRLRQVYLSLLSNAIGYAPQGGLITITSSCPTRDALRVQVSYAAREGRA